MKPAALLHGLAVLLAARLPASASPYAGGFFPVAAKPVDFSIEGSGEIVAVDNGDPTAHTPFQAMRRSVFNGPVLVIVRARPGAGCPIVIRAAAEGLDPVSITINTSKP